MPEAFSRLTPDQMARAVYDITKMMLPSGISKLVDSTKKMYDLSKDNLSGGTISTMQPIQQEPLKAQPYLEKIQEGNPSALKELQQKDTEESRNSDLILKMREIAERAATQSAASPKEPAKPATAKSNGQEEPAKPGVIMTPETIKELEDQRQALIQKRIDLERQRRMDEYDQRAQARNLRVQDTLEQTGLLP